MNIAHLLVQQATLRPTDDAIIEGPAGDSRRISFADLADRTARAAALLRQAGVRRGDHVLLFVPMSIELYVAMIAVFRIGAVATFADPSAGRGFIARCCDIVKPTAMIAISKAHWLRVLSASVRRIPVCFAALGRAVGARSFSDHQTVDADPQIDPVPADHPALVTFTSGSTGLPKAAVRSHGFLAAQLAALAPAIELVERERDLSTLAVFSLANLACGVTSIIPDADLRRVGAIDPAPVLQQIRTHQPTRLVASPAFLTRLLDAHAGELRCFLKVYTGGAPVFPILLDRLQSAMPEAKVLALYGSTEAEPIAHIARREMSESDIARMHAGDGLLVGHPVPEVSLRIIENRFGAPLGKMVSAELDAMTLGSPQVGEIVVTGDHVLKGYLHGRGEEQTKFRIDGAVWHRTGDAGYLDDRGRLWLMGRAEARVTDAHGTIYPFAVETAVSNVRGLRRSALIAHEGRRVLVIQPAPDAPADLIETLRARLHWANIDEVRVVYRIPLDARHNAKIDYPALRVLVARRPWWRRLFGRA